MTGSEVGERERGDRERSSSRIQTQDAHKAMLSVPTLYKVIFRQVQAFQND